MNKSEQTLFSDSDGRIAEITEMIRLIPRRISGRGIEGDWPLKLRKLFRERGYLYETCGYLDKAILDYTEVINTFINGRSDKWTELISDYFNRARINRRKGDLKSVIQDYSKMIELYPEFHLAPAKVWVSAYYKIRAEVYREMGDYKNANSDLAESLRLDPRGVIKVDEYGVIRASTTN